MSMPRSSQELVVPDTASVVTENTAYYREAVYIPVTDDVVAVAALMRFGGRNLSLATTLMKLLDFGWGMWEEEVRLINRQNATLPSWLVSSLRGGMRTEMVLCHYGMTPRHGELIGIAFSPFSRLQRLVLIGNALGSQGCAGLAVALASPDCSIKDALLDKCDIGDDGAAALASVFALPTRLKVLQLEENNIGDRGAMALASTLASNRSLWELALGGNRIGQAGIVALQDAFTTRSCGTLRVHSRFYPEQRDALDISSIGSSIGWRSYCTVNKKAVFPRPSLPVRSGHAGKKQKQTCGV